MKNSIRIALFVSTLLFSFSAYANKSIEDVPTGILVKTHNTSLTRDYTLAALATLASRGIDTNFEIANHQATVANVCATLPLPWVPPKENNPYYWTMTGVQFGGKAAIKNSAGTIVGYRFVSLIQCGLFDRSKSIPTCIGTKC